MFIVNVSKNVINYSNPFILIDFEQMDFNWGHPCDMIKIELTMKKIAQLASRASRIKYFSSNACTYRQQ